MTALLREHFVVIFLILFAGILFWAFRPRIRRRNQTVEDGSSSQNKESR
ncbi:MAG: cbb3-type cytochrome c oxidase subunit 3 [Rhodospirillales bacterium]|nr:cbb3-type cytochrome c oxidase subunit 3 [Rhodospirillales bacterium]